MNPFERPHMFDPLDLEIIEQAYAVALDKIEMHDPHRDVEKDSELKQALRRRLFAMAGGHIGDPETLCNTVLATMPDYSDIR